MNGLVQDLRYAFRQLRKSPGFACTAILMLALGIGASVAIFGFVDAALIKPLPYPNPNRLVDVTESVAMIPRANLSYPDYLDWKKLNHVFSSMDVYTGGGYLLRTATGTEPVPGLSVSDGFFRTLGITPVSRPRFLCGRGFAAAPPNRDPELRHVAETVWRKKRCDRRDRCAQRRSLHHRRSAAAGFPIRSPRKCGVLDDASRHRLAARSAEAATTSTESGGSRMAFPWRWRAPR